MQNSALEFIKTVPSKYTPARSHHYQEFTSPPIMKAILYKARMRHRHNINIENKFYKSHNSVCCVLRSNIFIFAINRGIIYNVVRKYMGEIHVMQERLWFSIDLPTQYKVPSAHKFID